MQPLDTSLRNRLAGMADEASPPGFTAQSMVARVRQRRLRATLSAAAGTTMLVLGVAAATTFMHLGTPTAKPPMPDSTAVAPAGPAQPAASSTSVYRCGDRLELPFVASGGPQNLSMFITDQSRSADGRGPVITVTFIADESVHVTASPAHLFQVLYLRDGIIVGGGPMLNKPGDDTPQGVDAVGEGFDVTPGQPAVLSLGPRETLCGSLTWEKVWSQPGRYDVVVVQGQIVTTGPDHVTLGVPLPLDLPLLASRTMLTG